MYKMDATGTKLLTKFTQAMQNPMLRRKRSSSINKAPIEKHHPVNQDQEEQHDNGQRAHGLNDHLDKRPQLPTPLYGEQPVEEYYDYTLDWRESAERNTSLSSSLIEAPVSTTFYENVKPHQPNITSANKADQSKHVPSKSDTMGPRSIQGWNTEHQEDQPRRINAVTPFSNVLNKARLEINKAILANRKLTPVSNLANTPTDGGSNADDGLRPNKSRAAAHQVTKQKPDKQFTKVYSSVDEPTGDDDVDDLYMNSMSEPIITYQINDLPQPIGPPPPLPNRPYADDDPLEPVSPPPPLPNRPYADDVPSEPVIPRPPLPTRPYADDDQLEPVSPPPPLPNRPYADDVPSEPVSPRPPLPTRPHTDEKPSRPIIPHPHLPTRPCVDGKLSKLISPRPTLPPPRQCADEKPSKPISQRPPLPIGPYVNRKPQEAVSRQPLLPIRPNAGGLPPQLVLSPGPPIPIRPCDDDIRIFESPISPPPPLPVRPYTEDNPSAPVVSSQPSLQVRPYADGFPSAVISPGPPLSCTPSYADDNPAYPITSNRKPVNCLTVQELIEQVRLLRVREHVIDRIHENLVDGPLIANMDKSLISDALHADSLETLKIYEFVHRGWKPNI